MTDLGDDHDRGRVLYAALHLVDHQMTDRNGTRCGNVDDLELTATDDGTLIVSALLAGPGVLAERLGLHRLGQWWRHATDAEGAIAIPMTDVAEIGSNIRLSVEAGSLATGRTERWARQQVVEHIPGHDVSNDPEDDD
jgi:hypothetical protein